MGDLVDVVHLFDSDDLVLVAFLIFRSLSAISECRSSCDVIVARRLRWPHGRSVYRLVNTNHQDRTLGRI
jgi:hypothetical protein